MQRKEFIQSSSVLLAGSLIAREKLFEIVSGEKIYGQNEKRYKLVKDWVKADATTLPVNDCHEMMQDAKGNIVLLTNETKNNVIFFNKKGKLKNTWGHDFPGAHGLTL
jgi:peptidylamidoglycolate lyase